MGPLNLPSTIPYHASQMYAQECGAPSCKHLQQGRAIALDADDEIAARPW